MGQINRFRWTDHALLRLDQRHLATFEVEQAIREQHEARRPNDGRANWLIAAKSPDGYDHPIAGDESVVLIVSAWRIDLVRYINGAILIDMIYAYYDEAADIAWFPTGDSSDVVSERVAGGLRDYDRETHQLVAIEVWDASTRLPKTLLDALPAPAAAHGAAA